MQSIGAINTIIRRPDGKLVGYNTDYIGAISAIEDGIGGLFNITYSLLTLVPWKRYQMLYVSQVQDQRMLPAHHWLVGLFIVVVGAGGAGKAIAYGAKEKGARVVIANRTYGKISISTMHDV